MKHRSEAEKNEIKGLVMTETAISIDSLYTLFEQRKRLEPGEIDTPQVRQAILEKYKINEPTLATLLKYYNNLAIMPPAIDDKEERRMGVWVTNKVDWQNQVKAVDRRNAEIKKAKQEAIKDNNRNLTKDEKQDQALKDLFDESY